MKGDDRLTATHVVIGTIRYDDVDNGQRPGVLSISGSRSPATSRPTCRSMPGRNHAFRTRPPTSGSRSTRSNSRATGAGDHIARDVFEDAVLQLEQQQPLWSEDICGDESSGVISSSSNWSGDAGLSRPPIGTRAISDRPGLGSSSGVTCARTPPWPHCPASSIRSLPRTGPSGRPPRPTRPGPLHAVGQMLRIMEDAWIGLGLKGHFDSPMNRDG